MFLSIFLFTEEKQHQQTVTCANCCQLRPGGFLFTLRGVLHLHNVSPATFSMLKSRPLQEIAVHRKGWYESSSRCRSEEYTCVYTASGIHMCIHSFRNTHVYTQLQEYTASAATSVVLFFVWLFFYQPITSNACIL